MKNLNEKIVRKYVTTKLKVGQLWRQIASDESGMGIVEIAIIILVIISLALLFQSEVETFLSEIFDKFSSDSFGVEKPS